MKQLKRQLDSLTKTIKKICRQRDGDLSTISPLSKRCNCGKITICRVSGDRKICSRMAAMGLYPGLEAEILCPAANNQCILRVQGITLCLDRSFTDHIFVTG